MRLLHTKRLMLEDFSADRIPPYAILSHRWTDDEIQFHDLSNGHILSGHNKGKRGYEKLRRSCEKAGEQHLNWIWIDTCCIDKSSSAELSESINSMYQWYQRAQVCYAFLHDVEGTSTSTQSMFANSVWWSRGWTLQELIAPSSVEFYNARWQKLGTKWSLRHTISIISGIDIYVLAGDSPQTKTVAQRMAWAANRETTRVEDTAYSLLGIFNVNMPLLYGEEDKAFVRLQQEIMKDSDDHSIFAWRPLGNERYRGLLARSPDEFYGCFNVVRASVKPPKDPYNFTNMGLKIELLTLPWSMDIYVAALDCSEEGMPDYWVGIFLTLLKEKNQYARVSVDELWQTSYRYSLSTKSQYRQMYIRQDHSNHSLAANQRLLDLIPPKVDRMYGFRLRRMDMFPDGMRVYCWMAYDQGRIDLRIPNGSFGSAAILTSRGNQAPLVLKLGFDAQFNPWCQYGPDSDNEPVDLVQSSLENTRWMREENKRAWKTDRLDGGSFRRVYMHEIKLSRSIQEGILTWIVDIVEIDPDPRGSEHWSIKCDRCGSNIYGTRYQCAVCPGYDTCSECYKILDNTHRSHLFTKIPDPWENLKDKCATTKSFLKRSGTMDSSEIVDD